MRKYLFSLLAFATIMSLAACEMSSAPPRLAETVPNLPNTFTVTEQVSVFQHVFKVEADNHAQTLGSIEEEIFSWARTFKYLDNTGALVATAKARPISWGYTIDVADAHGQPLGTIKEQVFSSLFGISNIYTVLDANDNKIAESDKFQFLDTRFTIKDNSGQVLATIYRPVTLFCDQWSVSYVNKDAVDSRLLVMIAAFKTAEDNNNDDD